MNTNTNPVSTDLTFITNEAGQSLRERLAILLGKDTRFFDCLVGYFFISGFHRIHHALENVGKIRILVGLRTDAAAYDLLRRADGDRAELDFLSHATAKERAARDALDELEKSADSLEIETGVRKFVEWIRSGKLEIKAHPGANLHAKVYTRGLPVGWD